MSRRSATCECGASKRVGDEACARCMALDGGNVPEQTLVNALRNLGGDATSEAVMVETGWSYRHLRRTAQRLERTGRVLRVETGEERHINMPTLMLDDACPPPRGWRQMRLPRFEAYLEPARFAAGSQAMVQLGRVVQRQRRAHRVEQLGFRFRRRRPQADGPERACA
jgi:hypothetical protein